MTEFIIKELSGWKLPELLLLFFAFSIIIYNAFVLQDYIIAVISAICGILYTVIAGKGKVSCYFFGLCGSFCYSLLSFQNALWGNLILYLFYYIPSQIYGFFSWKKNLKEKTMEIKKIRLSAKERIILFVISVIGSFVTIIILNFYGDGNSVIDGITTFMSMIGMYLTIRRAIEQWIVWMIVNGLSLLMWCNIVLHGTRAYSTLVMWAVYCILAVYFYILWKKELENTKAIKNNEV